MGDMNVKADARRLFEELPETATWDDLMEAIYTRQIIEAGLDDVREGRIVSDEEVWKKFGVTQ
jgi:predicted transcriptional regulator